MVTVHRKIQVKVVVTEQFKEALAAELQENIKKLDAEISFIEQRTKKTITELTLKASPQVQSVREQLEWEKKKREDAKNGFIDQIKKVGALQEGVEVLQGEVDGPAEVEIGMNWEDLFTKEIVIKDGLVVELR